jgi:hypothetical protein
MNKFVELAYINVNDKTEKKNGLTYLSWAWAWAEFTKIYPEATYEIIKNDGLPYFNDQSGAMVYTTVTAGGVTREMWLPVMDGANKAMKSQSYAYKDRYGKEKMVNEYTMFDINKTIMRCLTKNLAMFGLGLYIYAGEDLPEIEEQNTEPQKPATILSKDEAITMIKKMESLEGLKVFWGKYSAQLKANLNENDFALVELEKDGKKAEFDAAK